VLAVIGSRLGRPERLAAAAATLAVGLAGCGSAGSPAPGPIVFAGRPDDPEAYGWQLMVVNPDGTGFRRLTRTDGDIAPRWSPDATKVVFERTFEVDSAACGLPACTQIWVVDADGQGQRRLTSVDEDALAPAWSPDGERIAFSKRDLERETGDVTDFQADIWVMNPDGGEEMRLTDLPGVEEDPAWSPDGERIAFATSNGQEGDIYVMRSDGSELTRLTDLPGAEVSPDWLPDGDRIAFSTEFIERADVYVVKADGSELRRLAEESFPSWSPDGDTIALLRAAGNEATELVIAQEDGSEERVVHRGFQVGDAVWSPDGRELAFTTDQETIWVVGSDGGPARKIWSRPGGEPLGLDWAGAPD
jgi:tol-pal system beta propeller repeat protein TolB